MPKGYPPSVFVSSTCYDLNQVRVDLRRFLAEMGLEPILSETPAFPVNPQSGPVENCLRAVKERADIFILIIGARYGTQNPDGRSITNLEYLEAKAKGLPVYVFVLKQILNVLPVWKKNPDANYGGIVDTPKLFEFVDSLRASENHWVFEFEEVLHIITTLRNQFGYLFMEGLALRDQVRSLRLPASLRNLSGEPLKLLIERPAAWEYLFLSSVLTDEMARDDELKWDLKYNLRIHAVQKLSDSFSMCHWLQQKFSEIGALVHSIDQLLNSAVQEALGPIGVPGNPELLFYVAQRISKVRRSLLEWTIQFKCTDVPADCERLLSLISDFSQGAISQIEGFPERLQREILKGLEANKRGEKYECHIMLTLSETPNMEEIAAEFQKLS